MTVRSASDKDPSIPGHEVAQHRLGVPPPAGQRLLHSLKSSRTVTGPS